MTKAKILALLAVMAMVLIVPAVVFAQSPPHRFFGTVTVNGLTAPSGTAVSAVIDGVEQGSTTVDTDGKYIMDVSQGSGNDIVFQIDQLTATQTASWEKGMATLLDLTADSSSQASGAGEAGAKGASGAKGSKGDKGDSGERGPAGPAGPAGSAGSAGSDGKAGAAGSDGAAGAAGSDGAAGKAGAAGSSGGGGPVGLIALILSIVAILGVIGVYFASKQSAA